jgi:uncharacterized RDD family membrane protein YckC
MDTATGVYFRKQDYAGVWRRLLTDTVDSATAIGLCAVASIPVWNVGSKDVLFAIWAAVFFSYFVLLKRSRFRTVGYRITGVRIVGFDGERPGLWPLTLRLIFMVLGPLNYFMDILWVSSDPHKQALRDKFAHTYVVRKDAAPAGTGKLIFRYYHIFGYNYLFREIES